MMSRANQKLVIRIVVLVIVLGVVFLENNYKLEMGQPGINAPATVATANMNEAGATVGAARGIEAQVVKVVDGDTIDVMLNGVKERVRLLGVNTPETVDPRKPVQCFGKEASDFTKTHLNSATVYLESDPTQGDRDKYDRLLRYINLADGTSFNLQLISEGYAFEYTYDLPYKYQSQFKAAQVKTREGGLGLWKAGVCEYK